MKNKQRRTEVVKEAKSGQVQKLRNQINKQNKEIERLKKELRSYDKSFKKTKKFLEDRTEDISLEDLIEAANNDKSLVEVEQAKPVCPKCLSENYVVINAGFGEVRSCGDCKYREKINE